MSKVITLYHIILTPKYRAPLLVDPAIERSIERHMKRMLAKYQCKIHALAIVGDHAHLMIEIPPKHSAAKVVQQVKRVSSWRTRQEYPELKMLRAFWGKRYFLRTVGGDTRHVQKYIKQQMGELAA
jgi:putative transposase